MREYHGIMKGIHDDIKGIMNDVKKIQHETTEMIGDYSQNRVQAQAEWGKMQDAIATIRKKGIKAAPEPARKVEKKEVVREKPIVEEKKAAIPVPEVIMTLEEKVLDYINKHPKGVKIAEMEEPLKETRMKLGFTAKNLLDNGKVLKVENVYYPKPKL
jgi:hypothetical protein